MIKLCECGCGKEVKNRFVSGHNGRNKKRIDVSIRQKGENNVAKRPEVRLKISQTLMGHECSEETKRKIGIGNTGKIVSDETKKQTSQTLNGHIVTQATRDKISKANTGHKITEEAKRKQRISILKTIEKIGEPNKGKHEDFILDELEKLYEYKILRHPKHIIELTGYIVDGYIPELNLCIEVDEPHHFKNGNLVEKDVIRQKRIEKELRCKFLRIKDKFN